MNIRNIVGIGVIAGLVGCASAPQTPQEQHVQNVVDDLPSWYVEVPQADDNNQVLYVAGTGKSSMLMLAKDKAILDVEKQLANKINAKVSSRVKQYIREVGAGTPLTIQDNEQVVKKLVTEANVAGYINEESEVMREGNMYRVYILAKYPIEDNTLRAIAQTEKLINKFKGDKNKAFKELDREIDANREGGQATYKTPVAEDVNFVEAGVVEQSVIFNDGITETITDGVPYDPTQSTE